MDSPAPLRVVFMGSDPIALPLLEWLAGPGRPHAAVVGVFTQPDRPAGRGQTVQPGAVKSWALRSGVPVHQPERLTDEDLRLLTDLQPDVCLVMAYGQILRDAFIAAPRLGTLNFHTSLLPSYRGASPVQTAVASGEKSTAVSLMRIVRELDAGPVADFEPVAIAPLDTASEVEAKLARVCVPLIARSLPRLAGGTLTFHAQDASRVTFCRKLLKTDGGLDFLAPASVLAARVNGLNPWPGCAVQVPGAVIKLGLADVGGKDHPGAAPGVVLGADSEGLLIGTGQGTLRVRRLQRPGGRMLAASEFLRGFPLKAGMTLSSAVMPPLVQAEPFRSKKTN
jgi:methionyl-tRNA formyltransferase